MSVPRSNLRGSEPQRELGLLLSPSPARSPARSDACPVPCSRSSQAAVQREGGMAVPALRDAEGTFGAVERATGPSSCAFAPWAEGCRGPGQRPGVVVLFTERFCSLDNQIRANSSISTESKDLPEAEVRLCQLSLARPCWPRANQGGCTAPKPPGGEGWNARPLTAASRSARPCRRPGGK